MTFRLTRRLAALALAVLPLTTLAVPPAHASLATTGEVQFVGTLVWPSYPVPYGTGGRFVSTTVVGRDTAGSVVKVEMLFTYGTNCAGAGSLDGTLKVTHTDGLVRAASFHVDYVGFTGVMTINGGAGGAGALAIVPSVLPDCAHPQPLTATVAGALAFSI